jgi:phenylacetate-CoA ligase
VNLERLKSLQALRELPLTSKKELRASYPYDMFAVPLRDIVRLHSTAGTTGHPIVVGYTKNDLHSWSECTARLLSAAGVTDHDVVQIAFNYNVFTGAFGFHQGAEQIGASVIPASMTPSVEKQLIFMKDFKTTVLVSTPGYALSIAVGLAELDVHPERLSLRLGIFGGEPWGRQARQRLEERLRLVAIDTYGLTEVMGPGVAGECHLRQGLHINEDHFIAEVIDPMTLEPLGDGEEGELVLTTITKEGFPLVRYRTGDISSLSREPCPCGRTFLRMAKVTGRTDDLIVLGGIGFFPTRVEEILMEVEGTSPHYQIILDREGGVDTIEVKVEVSEETPSLDELRSLEALRDQIARRIDFALDVRSKVTLVEPKSLRRGSRPKDRVVDRRQA